jgi:rRNA maturation endonuclease Nob1
MKPSEHRAKLNVTIDKHILQEAKKVAARKRVPVSRLIESFLEFVTNPEVYCFKCGERFDSGNSKLCPKCGWMVCPKCNVCRCNLSEETAVAVFHMRRVYEDLLAGRVKAS